MAEFINTALGFVAQQNFVCGGVSYSTGDAFSIEGLSERELERLWRYRRIRNGEPATMVAVSEPDVPVQEPDVPVQEPDVPVQEPDVPVQEPDAPGGNGLEFVKAPAGGYNVELAGVVINDKVFDRLKAAKAWATEQGYC